MTDNQKTELFELCKQVYEATGWDDTTDVLSKNVASGNVVSFMRGATPDLYPYDQSDVPEYTSDYLLEKLLPTTSIKFAKLTDGNIGIFYQPTKPDYADYKSDTPLKALLKLTIALKESGEL
jgi:hypothetical protein